jgi:condensin complex subunit 3
MPGRVSARSLGASTTSRQSAVSRKSSTQTLRSRASASSRISTNVDIPDEGPDSDLRTQISSLFGDAQKTTAGHRKLVIKLRKIQEACCYEPSNPGKESEREFGQEEFTFEFGRCVVRLMGVKKSESVGDRVVRFIGLFLKHAGEKGEDCNPPNRINS